MTRTVRLGDRVRVDSMRIGGADGDPGETLTGVVVAFHHYPARAEIRTETPDRCTRVVDLAEVTVVETG